MATMSWKKLSFAQILIGLQQIWIVLTPVASGYSAKEPRFLGRMENSVVVQGKDASFRCMVDHLGDHRIAWIKVDSKAILAINHTVITNNARLSVVMNDKLTWTLHIKSVERRDNGSYMCQINSDPMQIQTANLSVVIPPDIISNETSGDLMVPEGGTAKLICKAKGEPPPIITWRREDGSPIMIRGNQGLKTKVKYVEGEILSLSKIVRSEMGAYLCVASNGVPPSVSQRVVVNVNFHPLIQVQNQLIAAPPGDNVLIECMSEASPKAIHYWKRETGGEMIISNDKYRMMEEPTSHYGVRMKLHIRNISSRDYTGYKCISQNSMGNAEGTIHIHEMPKHPIHPDDSMQDMVTPLVDESRVEDKSTREPHHHHVNDHHNPRHHHIETPVMQGNGGNNVKAAPWLSFTFLWGLSLTVVLRGCYEWCSLMFC